MAYEINIWFGIAAMIFFLTWGVHSFLGGREIAEPLLEVQSIHPVVKFTMYYCWHLVTIVLIFMTIGFALAAYHPQFWLFAMEWTMIAALFALWSLALILWKKQNPFHLIQWILFIPITVSGIIGLSL